MDTKKFTTDELKNAKANAMSIWKKYPYHFKEEDKVTIESRLKYGGFGYTYKGYYNGKGNLEEAENIPVAIKEFFLKDEEGKVCCRRNRDGETVVYTESEDLIQNYRKRFIREAKTLSKIDNPNIVKVKHLFEQNNTSYYAMELINGPDLAEHIMNNKPYNIADAWLCLRPVCVAVKELHEKGIAHRDISPQNILIDEDDPCKRFVLIDFGNCKISKDSNDGLSKQAPAAHNCDYSAPELIDSNITYDLSTCITQDIYSLSLVLYTMVTGKKPKKGYMSYNVFPESLRNIIRKAIEQEICKRYKNLEDFIKDCDEAIKKEDTISITNDTDINISTKIKINELVSKGPLIITLPIDDTSLSSDIIEGYSWRAFLEDNNLDPYSPDFKVGNLRFKRVSINVKVINDSGKYKLFVQ